MAQTKYACIRRFVQPTGGHRRIDSRLCSLLRRVSTAHVHNRITGSLSQLDLLSLFGLVRRGTDLLHFAKYARKVGIVGTFLYSQRGWCTRAKTAHVDYSSHIWPKVLGNLLCEVSELIAIHRPGSLTQGCVRVFDRVVQDCCLQDPHICHACCREEVRDALIDQPPSLPQVACPLTMG